MKTIDDLIKNEVHVDSEGRWSAGIYYITDKLKQLIIDRIKELKKQNVLLQRDIDNGMEKHLGDRLIWKKENKAKIKELIRLGNIKKGDLK